MYITIPATASDLSQSALHLLVAVVACAPSGSEVNMTQQDLAVAVKASRSTVQRALLELQQVGLVEVIHRGPGSPILCLPWRESIPTARPSKTASAPSPSDVEQRLSSMEARLSELESRQPQPIAAPAPANPPAPTASSPVRSVGSLNVQKRGRR